MEKSNSLKFLEQKFYGAGSQAARVLRGGAFDNNLQNVRCAYRNNNDPDNRDNNIGFRVALATFFKSRKI